MQKFIWPVLLAMSLLCGCIQLTAPPGTIEAVSNSLPVITGFYANPPVITIGQSSNLVWNIIGASNVTINPATETIGSSGTMPVAPSATTTYTLIANNGFGSTSAAITVTVNPIFTPPSINTFSLSPAFINPGQPASLTWDVSGATSVSIDPGIGAVAGSGSQNVYPGYTTTYILTASNSAGVIVDTTILSVTNYPTYSASSSAYPPYAVYPYYYTGGNLPVIVSFNINPPVVSPGEPAVLSWDVAGANSVSINPGFESVASSGAVTLTPNSNSYYTLTATGDGGAVSTVATVSVSPLSYYNYWQPTVPDIPTPGYDEPQQLPSLSPAPTPTESGNDYQTQELLMKPSTHSTTLTSLPRIIVFDSSPAIIKLGNPAELRWKVIGATSVNISPDVGFVSPDGMVTVTPSRTTVYKITASNSAGVIQHVQEVTVPRTLEKPKQQ